MTTPKENLMKTVRAVVVYDISFRNTLKELNEVSAILEAHAQKMVFPLGVKVHQTQAEIVLKQMRGRTGPLSEVDWRGTRGPNKRKRMGKIDRDRMRTLAKAGMKVAAIAEELNCTPQTVYVVLRASIAA